MASLKTNQTAAAAPKKKRSYRKRKKPAKKTGPLPPPIENAPQAEPEKLPESGGLFGLGKVFSRSQPNPLPSPESGGDSSTSSTRIFSHPEPNEPLTMESEQLLDRVPEVIGDGDSVVDPNPAGPGLDAPPMGAPVSSSLINEDDVRKYLEEGHDWIADFLQMEHWRLSERQSAMLGGPLSQVLQSVSGELASFLPAFIRDWCARTPGAAGLLVALTVVEGPKVAVTLKVWRERSREAREARNSRPVGTRPQPIRPQAVPPANSVGPKPATEPDDERIPARPSGINWD